MAFRNVPNKFRTQTHGETVDLWKHWAFPNPITAGGGQKGKIVVFGGENLGFEFSHLRSACPFGSPTWAVDLLPGNDVHFPSMNEGSKRSRIQVKTEVD